MSRVARTQALLLEYREIALEHLSELPPDVQVRIERKVTALLMDPRPRGSKLLRGGKSVRDFRIRHGRYRIMYRIEGRTLIVVDIDDRKDVYRGK